MSCSGMINWCLSVILLLFTISEESSNQLLLGMETKCSDFWANEKYNFYVNNYYTYIYIYVYMCIWFTVNALGDISSFMSHST